MTHTLSFTKMQAAGNDYIYIYCPDKIRFRPSALAPTICDRHFGVGADGVVLIIPLGESDFQMRMYNADGSEGAMCGNAARCVGKYVYERGYTRSQRINLHTKAGLRPMTLHTVGNTVRRVSVDMGEARVRVLTHDSARVNVGNPHLVQFLTAEEFDALGQLDLGSTPENREFVTVDDPYNIRMRVWERGSGETLACGTGACAVLAAANTLQKAEQPLTIHALGGKLQVAYDHQQHIILTGDAHFVFDATYTY